MNRGSNTDACDLLERLRASMRPRFMNRGSGPCDAGSSISTGRFNEAPIHESGKSR